MTAAPKSCVAQVFYCKVCGVQKGEANRWFLVECREICNGDAILCVREWDPDEAKFVGKRDVLVPVCGEAHAQVLLARWFESKSFEPSRQFIPEGSK
ncbi:MAG TPA: hypothetical protein VN538_04015 [Clostridia bacterium]|nr:hypothetical protein [Clostridia bacterium]